MPDTIFGRDFSGSIPATLKELFESRGYTRYRMGKFEEYDLYAKNRSFITGSSILTFTDTDGRLMALKPDVTLSLIKNTVPGDALRKVYYAESVYRARDAASGFAEIPQAGLECIGELDLYSVCEVISLAAGSLGTINERYILDLSHMGLLSGVLEDLEAPQGLREELLRLAGEKNSHEARSLWLGGGGSARGFELFNKLMRLRAPLREGVEQAEAMGLGPRASAALAELRDISGVLGTDRGLWLDPSLLADPRYYNGVVMRGYLPGASSAVLSGGRYDGLMRRMKRGAGAMGFALYMDVISRLLPRKRGLDADVLVLHRGGGAAELEKYVEELTSSGLRVRVDRAKPEGLCFGRVVIFDGEGPRNG